MLVGKVRPLRPGYSISVNGSHEMGTLGAFISYAGSNYILSNSHVLVPKPFAANQVAEIRQPGEFDGDGDVVADLTAYNKLIAQSPGAIDAAIAMVRTGIGCDATYGNGIRAKGVVDPLPNMKLHMVSRTSEFHTATVVSIGNNFTINIDNNPAWFSDVVELKNDSLIGPSVKGDSGGVWFDDSGNACLLNFAGNFDDDKCQVQFMESKLAQPVMVDIGNGIMLKQTQKFTVVNNPIRGWGVPMSLVMSWVKSVLGNSAQLTP